MLYLKKVKEVDSINALQTLAYLVKLDDTLGGQVIGDDLKELLSIVIEDLKSHDWKTKVLLESPDLVKHSAYKLFNEPEEKREDFKKIDIPKFMLVS